MCVHANLLCTHPNVSGSQNTSDLVPKWRWKKRWPYRNCRTSDSPEGYAEG